MTTTEYFPIAPLGQGTVEIEALGSLLCRMAISHSVCIHALSTHLVTWWLRKHSDASGTSITLVNGKNPMFCGTGLCVQAFVDLLNEAVGSSSLEQTTFLALRPVLSLQGHGVVREGRVWCPACLEEATRNCIPFYDRLIWAIPNIKRCSFHRVALQSLCPRCGARQSRYHHLGQMTVCFKCKGSLSQAPSEWEPALNPTIYEKECHQLVEAIAAGNLRTVVPDAYSLFINEATKCASEIFRAFGHKSQIAVAVRPLRGRVSGRPHFRTLLKRCLLLGISPVDLIQDPIGAFNSIDLLDLAAIDVPADLKPKRPEHLVKLAEQRIRTELEKTDFDSLTSLAKIAKDLGVSKGFLNYRLYDLCAQYAHHRKYYGYLKHVENIRLATDFLLSGPVLSYPSPKFPSHDHLVAAAVSETGVGVRVGRLAVEAALKRQLSNWKYRRYREANGLFRSPQRSEQG